MSIYLYKTVLYTNINNVIGVPVSNTVDLADFNTNFKNSALEVSVVNIAETSFQLVKSYTAFKALIVNPILWSDVKYVVRADNYELYLLSEQPL